MHDNLIILAGGASSRMKREVSSQNLSKEEIDQANERSKALISVGPQGRPLLDYLLFNARQAGYKNIYLVISEKGELFKKYYGQKMRDNDFNGLNLSFAVQYIPEGREKPFGTADALYQALEQYPELNSRSYTVCNSDNLYSVEALSILRDNDSYLHSFISYDRDALDFPQEKIARFALVKSDSENKLTDIIEKPPVAQVVNFKDNKGKLRVSMNIFMFNGTVFHPYIKNCPVNTERNEKEIPT
ncbi:MAG: NTP transferase domain-containing protein, partial [Flavobacteriaceae bacterium]|nr:NTP transferase domain-containing protein [Flavobacteriaceae bacterium]